MQVMTGRRMFGTNLSGASDGRKALMVALVLGLLAAYLSWMFLQRAGAGARAGALVPVVVAAVDIPVRAELTPEMLKIKQVPADARHAKALTAFEQAAGKVTNLPIAAGEQVLSTKFFSRKEDSGLAFRIPPGKRAVSVNVNEVITSGGLIVPGDFVDVISVFSGVAAAAGREVPSDLATIVLQNVEVLAVAQSLQGTTEATGLTGAFNGTRQDPRQEAVARPTARTATLAVTPEEAQKLILAEEKGKIRLALRAVDDHDTSPVPATSLTSVKS